MKMKSKDMKREKESTQVSMMKNLITDSIKHLPIEEQTDRLQTIVEVFEQCKGEKKNKI